MSSTCRWSQVVEGHFSIRKWCHLDWMPKGHPRNWREKLYISPSWRDFSKFGDALKGCCFCFPNETVQMRSEIIKGTFQIGGEEFKGGNSYISRAPGLLTSFTLGYIIGWTPSFQYHTKVFDPVVGWLWPCVLQVVSDFIPFILVYSKPDFFAFVIFGGLCLPHFKTPVMCFQYL